MLKYFVNAKRKKNKKKSMSCLPSKHALNHIYFYFKKDSKRANEKRQQPRKKKLCLPNKSKTSKKKKFHAPLRHIYT